VKEVVLNLAYHIGPVRGVSLHIMGPEIVVSLLATKRDLSCGRGKNRCEDEAFNVLPEVRLYHKQLMIESLEVARTPCVSKEEERMKGRD